MIIPVLTTIAGSLLEELYLLLQSSQKYKVHEFTRIVGVSVFGLLIELYEVPRGCFCSTTVRQSSV